MGSEGSDAAGFGDERVAGLAAGIEDSVVVWKDAQREEAFAQVEPDAVDRVEFGRIGRQRHEADGAGHPQRLGAVPAGLVDNEHGVDVGREPVSRAVAEVCIASVETSGRTSAKSSPVAGRTAAKIHAQG
jgi:hypothetical protein